MRYIVVLGLVLSVFLAFYAVPVKVNAQGLEQYATVKVEGTSAEAGEQVNLKVTVDAKADIRNVKATITSLAPQLVLIQKTGEVDLIQKGEMRVINIPIGTSKETPEGRYKVTYQVEFSGPNSSKYTTQGDAFVTVKSPSEGCFIATAVYGTDAADQINILRELRDKVLLSSDVGTGFVHFYYQVSPPVAAFISRHDTLRAMTRWVLIEPMVWMCKATAAFWRN
jgi:hypothetical protein